MAPFKSLEAFLTSYYLGDKNEPPLILGTMELFSVICRIYRQLLPDLNDQFTSRTIIQVREEFDKVDPRKKIEAKRIATELQRQSDELEAIRKNKRQNPREIEELEAAMRKQSDLLLTHKRDYYIPLIKTVTFLSSVLEQIDLTRVDVNIAGLGHMIPTLFEVDFAQKGPRRNPDRGQRLQYPSSPGFR